MIITSAEDAPRQDLGTRIADRFLVCSRIRHELMQEDCVEIEQWISECRVTMRRYSVDCKSFDTIFREKKRIQAGLSRGAPFLQNNVVAIEDLAGQPFILWRTEERQTSQNYWKNSNVKPDIRFTTRDDYAILPWLKRNRD